MHICVSAHCTTHHRMRPRSQLNCLLTITPLGCWGRRTVRYCPFTAPPQRRAKIAEEVRNWSGDSADASEHSYSPVDTKILVHGNTDNSHTAGDHVANQGDESEGGRSVGEVRIDNIHVYRHEDADGPEADSG